jgi:hypothetical protein
MVPRRRVVTADEHDVYTGWRKLLIWTSRPGATKKVKKRTHRRERREGKQEIREQLEDG